MNSKDCRYILAAADLRSISRAAEQFDMAQSNFSKNIARIERELGCRLFDRSVIPLRLTPAGEVYASFAL